MTTLMKTMVITMMKVMFTKLEMENETAPITGFIGTMMMEEPVSVTMSIVTVSSLFATIPSQLHTYSIRYQWTSRISTVLLAFSISAADVNYPIGARH